MANETLAIESADDFADRQWSYLGRDWLRISVRERDAAIAAQARREALLEAKATINALNYAQPYGVAAAMNAIDQLLTPTTAEAPKSRLEVFQSCKAGDGYGYEKVDEIEIPDATAEAEVGGK